MNPRGVRTEWGTRFGFYLAAVGSALGLGNLWRFPFVVSEHGGGAFIFLYIFASLLIGGTLMIGELVLGKLSGRSVIAASHRLMVGQDLSEDVLSRRDWRVSLAVALGRLTVCAGVMVTAYHAVVSGWTLHLLAKLAVSQLGVVSSPSFLGEFAELRKNGGLQWLLASAHLMIATYIVIRGVRAGVERALGTIAPVFFLSFGLLIIQSLRLPTAEEALRFLFYPDFLRLKPSSLLAALAQACFSLGIGMGTLITFGSYLPTSAIVPTTGFRLVVLDTMISIAGVVILFPPVFQIMEEQHLAGPDILFTAFPRLVEGTPEGPIFGLFVLVCLYLACLTASIGLMETLVANAAEILRLRRTPAALTVGGLVSLLALVPALSSSSFAGFSIFGRSFFDFWDHWTVEFMIPISAVAISVLVGWRLRRDVLEREFKDLGDPAMGDRVFRHWRFALRWVIPLVFAIAFLLAIGCVDN